MVDSTLLDKLVGYVSPQRGLRRAQARTAMSLVRAYEGAAVGRRTEGWVTLTTSPNTELRGAITRLRARSRDLVRNNPWANRAVAVIDSNTVKTGIVPQARSGRSGRGRRYDLLWAEWAGTEACDYDGQHDFYGLQSLAMRTIVESGSVLVRRHRMPTNSNLPVPLQLQVMEPDFLDCTREFYRLTNGNTLMRGIEFDPQGRRVAYWLYPQHPGNLDFVAGFKNDSIRVPAASVRHIYRADRAGQVDGVPWAAPIMIKLRDFDDYDDAQLQRQKIAACFAAFVYDHEGAAPALGEDAAKLLVDKLEPGLIETLPPGKDIKFGEPPRVDGYGDYQRGQLLAVATGFGITYEALTGDLRNVNFSSGRMGWLEFHRNITSWQQKLIIGGLCRHAWRWFDEAAGLIGYGPEAVDATWTPPRREMIDPVSETKAMKDAIRAGLMTLPEAVRMFGYDFEDLIAEYASANQRLDELGLVLDCDARKMNAQGAKHAAPKEPANEDEDEDQDAEDERAALKLIERALA